MSEDKFKPLTWASVYGLEFWDRLQIKEDELMPKVDVRSAVMGLKKQLEEGLIETEEDFNYWFPVLFDDEVRE